ncbi:MAG: PP2C family protein-serine/threonine phosphatase [Phycisphaeraceae bacterium]
MHRLQCGQVFGGIQDEDTDLLSNAVEASLYSASCQGGKGGDIYFLSVCRQDAITRIALADVMGHGDQVSDVSQLVYEALRDHMNDFDGQQVLEQVNRVAADMGIKAMTTAALLGVYTGDDTLRFSYAGHHPALLRRAGDSTWQSVEPDHDSDADNLPLAVSAEASYDQHDHDLGPGDQLLLYTDGVLEARSPQGDEFGLRRLTSILATLPHDSSLPDAKTIVIDAVRHHVDGPLDHDDITVIAIQPRPKVAQ